MKNTDVHVYSNDFLAPMRLPLNQLHSLQSNILQLNLLRRVNRLQYADRRSHEMPIFYNNAAIIALLLSLFK